MLAPSLARAERGIPGEWQLYNTYDYYFQETIDTPDRVYVLALAQINYDFSEWAKKHGHLFALDKKTGEFSDYNASNKLNGNEILDISYNPAKGYLLIIYDNYAIDFLYDDETVRNISTLSASGMSLSKNVNSVTFDSERNRVYLATDFGYMAIDDTTYQAVETNVFDRSVSGVAAVGDYLILGTKEGLFTAPYAGRHASFDLFTPVSGHNYAVKYVLPLTDNTFGVVADRNISLGTISADGSLAIEKKSTENVNYFSDNRDGYFMRRSGCAFQLDRQGGLTPVYIDKTSYGGSECGSWDMKDFYFPASRKGLVHITHNDNQTWEKEDLIVPNAPRVFIPFYITNSPKYGMLLGNGTFNRIFNWGSMNYTSIISTYKDGLWSQYGCMDLSDPGQRYAKESYGPVMDDSDPDYMWIGTLHNGLLRIDLRDNSMEIFAHPAHDAKSQPGFHAVFPTSVNWRAMCNVSAPSFDNDGNLWCIFNPSHAADESQPLYCWKAEDRRAGNVGGFKNVPVKGYGKHYDNFSIVAAKHADSKNLVYFVNTKDYFPPLYIFHHAGTIDDTSDDTLMCFSTFRDQDNTTISYTFVNAIYEDPATGLLWIGTDSGLFTVDPRQAMRDYKPGSGILSVNRIKVKGEVDYLLAGSSVMSIASDAQGRKWFGTMGNGLVATSADGSEILDRFTTQNSLLPSDEIYGVGCDPSTGAVWIGSNKQIAAYYCNATPAAGDLSHATAWPNPVRPGHQGVVTLRNVAPATPLCIADASGNLVKNLGQASEGMALWDLTDEQGNAVAPGLYYLTGSDLTKKTLKIQVVR